MFGLLNSSQIYGLHQAETNSNNSNSNHYNNNNNTNNHNNIICNRQTDKLSNSNSGMKISANFLEKFIKSEVIAGAALDIRNGYDAVKNLKNFHNQNNNLNNNSNTSSNLNGNYRHHHNHTNGCETTDNMTNPIKSTTNSDNIKGTNSCSRKTGRKLNADKDKDKEHIDGGNSNDVISELKTFDRQSGSSSVPSSSTVSSSSSTESPGAERKIPATTMDTMQRKKFIQMVAFLDHQNQRLHKELAKEKRRRAEELSLIIKSLLCFEAKLKVDKKVINQKLLEKDNEICRLVSLNRALMKKCNGEQLDDSLGDQQECDVMEALQCMTCKKDFYGIESKESWAQTGKEGRSVSDDHTTEHGSSSDDTLSSSFYGARRSIRYTSKRTFGTFRDYMRSRSMNIDDLNLDNSEENTSTISRDDSQNSYEKMNVFSRTIDRMHGVRRVSSFEGDLDSENDNNSRRSKSKTCSNSSGVDDDEHMHSLGHEEEDEVFVPKSVAKVGNSAGRRLKGFLESSPQQAFETSTDDWYASASEPEEAESVRTKPYGYNAVNPVLECVNQILLQQSMEECLNDSPTSLEGSEHNSNASSGAIGGNTGSGNVSSTSSLSSGKENNNGTVGRKRVHFSTKNSMVHVPRDDDNSMPTQLPSASVIAEQIKDNILNYESIYSNEYEPIGSEQNSSNLYVDMETKLGQEDRRATEKPKQPPALPPKPANLMKFKRVTKPTSIRSQSPQTEQPVIIKDDDKSVISEPDYCSISEVNMAVTSVKIIADVHKIPDDTSTISREEISDTQISTILSPQKTYEIEEIFADIPKLPNVAAIIAPKTPTKITSSNDNNYVSPTLTTNSHHHSIYQQQQRGDDPLKPKSPRQIKRKHVPNILAEINKRMNNSNVSTTILASTTSPNSTPIKISQSPKKVLNHPLTSIIKLNPNSNVVSSSPLNSPPITSDKLPLQAEFDWYNLDAEYGKSPNQPDVIQPSDSGIIEEINEFDVGENDSNLMHPHGVEYNLDEEFSLSNQPDIIKENVLEQKLIDEENANNLIDTQIQLQQIQSLSPPLTTTTIITPITISDSFPIITDTTPCTKKIKTQNFDSFLDNSGLSSKPLPRQRKIYFAGPFV